MRPIIKKTRRQKGRSRNQKEINRMISPIREITLGGWIYLAVFAAWMASIYIFAFRDYKAQQKAEENWQRALHESPPLNLEIKKE